MTVLAGTSVRSALALGIDLWLVFAAYWGLVTWHLVRALHSWRVRSMLLAVALGPVGYVVARVARRRERTSGSIAADGGDDEEDDVDEVAVVDWSRL